MKSLGSNIKGFTTRFQGMSKFEFVAKTQFLLADILHPGSGSKHVAVTVDPKPSMLRIQWIRIQTCCGYSGSGSKHVADTVDPDPNMLRIQWIRIQTCCGYSGSASKHVADTVDSDSDSNQRYIHFTV